MQFNNHGISKWFGQLFIYCKYLWIIQNIWSNKHNRINLWKLKIKICKLEFKKDFSWNIQKSIILEGQIQGYAKYNWCNRWPLPLIKVDV